MNKVLVTYEDTPNVKSIHTLPYERRYDARAQRFSSSLNFHLAGYLRILAGKALDAGSNSHQSLPYRHKVFFWMR